MWLSPSCQLVEEWSSTPLLKTLLQALKAVELQSAEVRRAWSRSHEWAAEDARLHESLSVQLKPSSRFGR